MYATILIPRFALQAALLSRPEHARQPAALVEDHEQNPRVLQVNRPAARQRIQPGITVPQALARCSSLVLCHPSPSAEAMADRLLFTAGYSITHKVEITFPGACTLDLAGARLTAQPARFRSLIDDLQTCGLHARIGISKTPELALLAARQAEPFLQLQGNEETFRQLPLSALDAPAELLDILDQWGIRQLGQLIDLPRQQIGQRLGAEGLALWDAIAGRQARPLAISTLPPEYKESLEFEYEIESLEPLLFVIRRFLDQLCFRLKVAHLAAEKLTLAFQHAMGPPWNRTFKIPEPTHQAEPLFRMLSAFLESIQAESPIVGLSMEIVPCPYQPQQSGLFETQLKNPHRFTQTLSRLAGIVGPENVGRPVLLDTHRPDAFELQRLPATIPPCPTETLAQQHGLCLRRFRPPIPAQVRWQGRLSDIQTCRPLWLSCSQATGHVDDCRGPWLASGGWWSDQAWNRAEWDVALSNGGLYRLVYQDRAWSLEGMYD